MGRKKFPEEMGYACLSSDLVATTDKKVRADFLMTENLNQALDKV